MLRKRRVPGAHGVWDLLLHNEMMRLAGYADIIDTALPIDGGREAMDEYLSIYQRPMRDKYKMFLRAAQQRGFTEEDHFQMVLEYGRTRNLGGLRQSMDVSIPVPHPPKRVAPSDSPTQGWDGDHVADDVDDVDGEGGEDM